MGAGVQWSGCRVLTTRAAKPGSGSHDLPGRENGCIASLLAPLPFCLAALRRVGPTRSAVQTVCVPSPAVGLLANKQRCWLTGLTC